MRGKRKRKSKPKWTLTEKALQGMRPLCHGKLLVKAKTDWGAVRFECRECDLRWEIRSRFDYLGKRYWLVYERLLKAEYGPEVSLTDFPPDNPEFVRMKEARPYLDLRDGLECYCRCGRRLCRFPEPYLVDPVWGERPETGEVKLFCPDCALVWSICPDYRYESESWAFRMMEIFGPPCTDEAVREMIFNHAEAADRVRRFRDLSGRLRKAREAGGFSHAQILARFQAVNPVNLDLTEAAFREWLDHMEAQFGRISGEDLDILADLYGVRPGWLRGGRNPYQGLAEIGVA